MIESDYLIKLKDVLSTENLAAQRHLAEQLAAQLGCDILDFAAVLLFLQADGVMPQVCADPTPVNPCTQKIAGANNLLGIKMLRYRLEVGLNHQVTVESLKSLLVDESGVDRNNINIVNINPEYTIIELPDEMPMDIFQHLKTVEINQQQLAIKRLKMRNKKRSNNRFRRARQRNGQANTEKMTTV